MVSVDAFYKYMYIINNQPSRLLTAAVIVVVLGSNVVENVDGVALFFNLHQYMAHLVMEE